MTMSTTFPGSFAGQTVTLTFDRQSFENPGSVLVFAFFQEKLLFTQNNKRGWELPGGKLDPGEWPIAAAIREAYEETGAELDALEPIAQYRVEATGEATMVKTVFIARIRHLHARPDGFETSATKLYATPPSHASIIEDATFSILLHDQVYPLVLAQALAHPFARA